MAMTKVILPRCKFCGSTDAVKCPNCGEWTCYECMTIINDSECIHQKYVPIQKWMWIDNVTS